jgi:hypothetical protein
LLQRRQLPEPLQKPSVPQPICEVAAHSMSGSVPFETPRQRPFAWPVLAIEQAMHSVLHADSQQNPSTQLLEVHWLFSVQAEPSGSVVPQLVPTHRKPVAQWESMLQLVLQAGVVSHAYGLQGFGVTVGQVPAPLQ